ncbi:MAG: YHYH protein [Polyangiaceae bacterium]
MSSARRALFMASVFVAACGGTSSTGGDAGNGTNDGGTGGDGGSDSLCVTNVSADVPEVYRRFFSCADVSVDGSNVVLKTRALPPYKTYYYGAASPNYAPFDTSRGPEYKGNPNTLREQSLTFRIPKDPVARGVTITAAIVDGVAGGQMSTYDYKMGPAGIAVNSVLLYNPLAAPGDDIEQEKYTFDDYNAHPDPGGNYHYHTVSKGPLEQLQKRGLVTKTTPGTAEIEFYGVMCDGTFVLGCTELDGGAPNTSDLDPQNGHVHDMKASDGAALATARYHVHMCPSGFASAPRKFTPEVRYYSTCVVE